MTEALGKDGSWAARWHEYLKAQGFDLKRGQALARRLQVRAVEVRFGRIRAEVVESHRGSCEVEIDIPPLRDEEWSGVLDALAGEALYAAQLLAGGNEWETFLAVLDAVFSDAEVALLSRSPAAGEVEARCTGCLSQGTPCKHTLVVLYRFGQMISEDPWQLLLLRGRDRQQVLTGLRLRRSHDVEEDSRDEGEVSGAASDSPIAGYDGLRALEDPANRQEEHLDLVAQIDTFWGGRQLGPGGTRQDLRALHYNIAPPLIRMALLRRLGPPPFQQDSPEIYDRLAEIYFEVSSKALELAFAPEPDSDGSR
ncbi:MAG: hypothetical protein F4X14_14280 [Caldilineaceae bacterium SB0661_bin_32]|uniref:SWIM-type domain-containing protein n=1 Tax=Caldilineaceae bacterium SB0661_bin_32 TaxID=2605255 RepID=A0A6B1D957_9CHLR|nr:hypothetical protein [Caldilineaceae bacterium SB0661_bin_32]